MRLSLWILFFLLVRATAFAEGLDLHSEKTEQPNFFAVSAERSSFSLSEGKIEGTGLRADFMHSFDSDFGVDLYLATAFTGQGGVQSSFTGLGGSISYNLWGTCCSSQKVLSLSGHPVLTEQKELGSLLQVAVGADQYFLNGSKAVYSASGLSAGLNYDFNLWSYRFQAAGRYSALTANQTSMKGLFFSFGMMFPL